MTKCFSFSCNKEFTKKNYWHKYCNIKCQEAESYKRNYKLKGRKVWNKGLTKYTDERIKKLSKQMEGDNNPSRKYGPWNKGKKLPPLSEDHKKKLRKSKNQGNKIVSLVKHHGIRGLQWQQVKN